MGDNWFWLRTQHTYLLIDLLKRKVAAGASGQEADPSAVNLFFSKFQRKSLNPRLQWNEDFSLSGPPPPDLPLGLFPIRWWMAVSIFLPWWYKPPSTRQLDEKNFTRQPSHQRRKGPADEWIVLKIKAPESRTGQNLSQLRTGLFIADDSAQRLHSILMKRAE